MVEKSTTYTTQADSSCSLSLSWGLRHINTNTLSSRESNMSCGGLSSISTDRSASILVQSTNPSSSSWLVSHRGGIGDQVATDHFVGEVGLEIGLNGSFFID